MNTQSNEGRNEARPVLAFLTSHWLSVIGSSLVTIAACSWLFLVALHPDGRTANPYIGILIAFAIPAVFFLGLILIPIGAWLSRRRIQAGLAQIQSRGTVIRRLGLFFATMTVVNVVIASQVTYRAVTHMETEQFCGQSCHVMKPQFTAHRRTAHRSVACVDCHIVPGAEGFVQAKMNGTRQLIEVVLNNYPRPVPPGLQSSHLAPSRETCEQCHSRTFDSGPPLRVISKFKDDESNTPTQTVLVMNVTRIHGAHMGPGVEIRYLTADPKRQTISSVEYRNNKTGESSTYSAANAKDTGAPQYVMECADCHNRQGHAFQQPEQAVDEAMAAGEIPVGLPFAHKTAIEALKTDSPAAFTAFYQQKYPDIAAKRSADIANTTKVLGALYDRNVFPDLGVKWGAYPNNLGHVDNAGCFRCHDESHATAAKKTITQDCTVCHNPLAVEETNPGRPQDARSRSETCAVPETIGGAPFRAPCRATEPEVTLRLAVATSNRRAGTQADQRIARRLKWKLRDVEESRSETREGGRWGPVVEPHAAGNGAGNSSVSQKCSRELLIMEDHIQKRTMHFERAVVFDEAEPPEFVHEEADSRTSGADHVRQNLLTDFGGYCLRACLLCQVGQQKESPGEPLLTGVEELVDQVLFNSNRACEHVGEKQIRKRGIDRVLSHKLLGEISE